MTDENYELRRARGPLDLEQRIADLTRQVDERDKRIKELEKENKDLGLALQRAQELVGELTDKVRKAEAMRRPLDTMDEIAYRELEKENGDLKYDNKLLAKQVEDKVEEVKALKMKLELLDNKT